MSAGGMHLGVMNAKIEKCRNVKNGGPLIQDYRLFVVF